MTEKEAVEAFVPTATTTAAEEALVKPTEGEEADTKTTPSPTITATTTTTTTNSKKKKTAETLDDDTSSEQPSTKRLRGAAAAEEEEEEEEGAEAEVAATEAAQAAPAGTEQQVNDEGVEPDLMQDIIQKQKELEAAKAKAQQRLNEQLAASLGTKAPASPGPTPTTAGGSAAYYAAAVAATHPPATSAPALYTHAAPPAVGPAVAKAPVDNACRIYVGSLHYDLGEEDVRKVFSPFGPIKALNMSFDQATGRSKGFAFVDYETPQSAAMALQTMNGFQLAGRPIKVGRPTPVNSGGGGVAGRQPGSAPAGYGAAPRQGGGPGSGIRIYVGSIPFEVAEEVVKGLFQSFGRILSCTLLPDPQHTPGRLHRGYGFIEFENEQAATAAIQAMQGFELYGRAMKVGWAAPGSAGGGGGGGGGGGMYQGYQQQHLPMGGHFYGAQAQQQQYQQGYTAYPQAYAQQYQHQQQQQQQQQQSYAPPGTTNYGPPGGGY